MVSGMENLPYEWLTAVRVAFELETRAMGNMSKALKMCTVELLPPS